MNIVVYPGTFDPITNGHTDLVERAARMFDHIIVAVAYNPKKKPMLDLDTRVDMARSVLGHLANVEVVGFNNLLADFVKEKNANIILRGLRAVSDFEYEFQRALLLKQIAPELETMFMMTNNKMSFISSSGVKELATFGGDITKMVPSEIVETVLERIRRK